MDLLWDKGFALCYKDRFNAAYSAGTNNLTRAGSGVLGEQLAEDLLATLNMLLSDARDQLSAEKSGVYDPLRTLP